MSEFIQSHFYNHFIDCLLKSNDRVLPLCAILETYSESPNENIKYIVIIKYYPFPTCEFTFCVTDQEVEQIMDDQNPHWVKGKVNLISFLHHTNSSVSSKMGNKQNLLPSFLHRTFLLINTKGSWRAQLYAITRYLITFWYNCWVRNE